MTQPSTLFSTRYIKLHFTLLFPENCKVPKYKVSAIRGGMGEMLLRANCIRDRKCEACDFVSECIVQRTMYSKFEYKPEYVTTGESIGYVLECEDYREELAAGDVVSFNLILFGKTIVYFSQYMQALYSLGVQGLGKEQANFVIVSVTNSLGEELLEDGNIYMPRYQVMRIADYVVYRKKQLLSHSMKNEIRFQTPLTLKFQGKFLNEFQMEPMFRGIVRRLYMLSCFEGNEVDITEYDYDKLPQIQGQEKYFVSVPRFSNRQNAKMFLKGIEGKIFVDRISEEQLEFLLAGELIHIGKNTSFGFGRYRIF